MSPSHEKLYVVWVNFSGLIPCKIFELPIKYKSCDLLTAFANCFQSGVLYLDPVFFRIAVWVEQKQNTTPVHTKAITNNFSTKCLHTRIGANKILQSNFKKGWRASERYRQKSHLVRAVLIRYWIYHFILQILNYFHHNYRHCQYQKINLIHSKVNRVKFPCFGW